MASKRWIIPDQATPGCEDLARGLQVSPFVARLLAQRGIRDERAGRRFLEPQLENLHNPFLLPDMVLAVERLARAIRDGERILVHGDYDVDGVCAAALQTRVLRVLNANVVPFTPHRRQDGYDLQVETVQREAASGTRLIVTVDCGIVAFEAADAAKELGVDLIITDHHEPRPDGELPKAVARVNPKRHDSEYPFPELCGTGVAYKLGTALVRHLGIETRKFETAFLDLVALATCADCMPLVDENRVFVRWGLETLRKTNKAGLKALMGVTELAPHAVTARSLGFVLGPRINAIGRLDASKHALELLLTGDAAEAETLARKLEEANRERQQEQERILYDAMRQSEQYLDDRILVLSSHTWHAGVIGIVASRMVETLCRPAVMIAIDEEAGKGRGSCRSLDGFHIFEALDHCRELLVRCGGHQAAAGFDIRPENIEPFRAALQEDAASVLDVVQLQPSVHVDAEIPLPALNLNLARELARLEPYGHGNPEPVFVTRELNILQQRRLQNRANEALDHLKLRIEHPTLRHGVDALFWRAWPRAEECPEKGRIDACYSVEVNAYNGAQYLQMNLRDLRACSA
jgi:single-stranded-DNA-specific exonuclease